MIKGLTHVHLETIWYHSEPSNVSYCPPNQFLVWDFFLVSYSKPALGIVLNLLKPTRSDFSYHFQRSRFQCKSIISFYSKLRKLQYFRQPYQHTRISHDVKVFQSRSKSRLLQHCIYRLNLV